MKEIPIHPNARLGTICLRVRELLRSVDFYTSILGFRLIDCDPQIARLGVGDDCLLILRENPSSRPAPRTAGLYHFAVLVPTRIDLARSIRHLIMTNTPLQGFADHLVSEAVYLADPDGNGIEIYRDRTRDKWPYRDGQLLMATDPLNVSRLLDELNEEEADWNGFAPETAIGHVHLQVSDLAQSVLFYQETLGLDLVQRYGPSAAFLSAGGYHHHVGVNTWSGIGIPPAPPEATGLIWFSIDLPERDAYEQFVQRLAASPTTSEAHEQGLLLRDPAGIGVMVRARSG